MPITLRAAVRPAPGVKLYRSTPGVTKCTVSGQASYNETKLAASASVFAVRALAAATIWVSPCTRIIGSGLSPSARFKFFTRAMVCMVCTKGSFNSFATGIATFPDSQ